MAKVTVTWHGASMDQEIRDAAKQLVDLSAIEFQRQVSLALSKPGSGRTYTKKSGRDHVASAPGEPPATDEGTLRRSWQAGGLGHIREDSTEGGKIRVSVGSNLPYASALEYGRLDWHIEPRPYARPSAEETRRRIPGIAEKLKQIMVDRINDL